MKNWLSVAKSLFIESQNQGGEFHLWGHSSEVEKLNMWDDLESFFAFIANQSDVDAVVNSKLII